MYWVTVILLVLSPAILYGIALLAVAISQKYFHRRCPSCGRRALRLVNWIRATILFEGKLAPDHWSYYLCTSCGKPHKLHRNAWEAISDEEFRQNFPQV